MSMTRREAVSVFSPLRQALDRFFEDSATILDEGIAHSPTLDLLTAGQPLPVDVYETATEYIIDAAIPGIPVSTIMISATPQMITVRAEWTRAARASEQPGRYIRHERFEGEMQRRIPLPFAIDASRISSSYANGVLTLRAPKIAQQPPTGVDAHVTGPVYP